MKSRAHPLLRSTRTFGNVRSPSFPARSTTEAHLLHFSSTAGPHLEPKEALMLGWALTFFILAIVAGFLGFSGVAGAAAGIAQVLFVIFLILLIVSFAARAFRGRPPV